MNRRVSLRDINPNIMCVLCHGYYVDATTIIECFHSFCRSCIVKHLESSKYCPICEVMVHKTRPLVNIRRDKTLQDIVYKLVPGLFAREMQNRRQFYRDRPHYVIPEDKQDAGLDDLNYYNAEDSIKLSLTDHSKDRPAWFLKCPIGVTIRHMKKLILAKFGFKEKKVSVEVMLTSHYLDNDLTLLEIASVKPWRSKEILEMSYEMFGVNEKDDLKINDHKELIKIEEIETPEKEIQLQITESGVMCVSEVDTRQSNDSINQVIASSLNVVEQTKPVNSFVDDSREKLKERVKRRSVDVDPTPPKKLVKESENKDEKKVLSHSVQNMVASPVKESKMEELPKTLPKPPVVERNKVPELSTIKKSDMMNLKPSPLIPPYVVEPRMETPKPLRIPTPTWRPVIPKEKLRPTLLSTEPRKPAKQFNRNMPRFLGNPASGVKPLYSNGRPETPSPPSSPSKKPDPIIRIDPKTLRPVEKDEKKTPNTLLTNPFIPRDRNYLLPDPKTQPYGNVALAPGFHASLPPPINNLMNHKTYRSVKVKEDTNSCDRNESRPIASTSASS